MCVFLFNCLFISFYLFLIFTLIRIYSFYFATYYFIIRLNSNIKQYIYRKSILSTSTSRIAISKVRGAVDGDGRRLADRINRSVFLAVIISQWRVSLFPKPSRVILYSIRNVRRIEDITREIVVAISMLDRHRWVAFP